MQYISFKANLIIDSKMYKGKIPNTDTGYLKGVFENYKQFLEIPVIKKLTDGDTIKISRYNYTERDGAYRNSEKTRKNHGWGVIIEFVSNKLKEPFLWPRFIGENCTSTLTLCDLESATFDFLGKKAGLNRGDYRKMEEFQRRILMPENK